MKALALLFFDGALLVVAPKPPLFARQFVRLHPGTGGASSAFPMVQRATRHSGRRDAIALWVLQCSVCFGSIRAPAVQRSTSADAHSSNTYACSAYCLVRLLCCPLGQRFAVQRRLQCGARLTQLAVCKALLPSARNLAKVATPRCVWLCKGATPTIAAALHKAPRLLDACEFVKDRPTDAAG